MTQLLPLGETATVFIHELVRPVSPFQDLRAVWSIYRALRRWKPDIVHTHMAKAGTLGRLASLIYNWTSRRPRRARLIHTYHGHVFEGYFSGMRPALSLCRAMARKTHRCPDCDFTEHRQRSTAHVQNRRGSTDPYCSVGL